MNILRTVKLIIHIMTSEQNPKVSTLLNAQVAYLSLMSTNQQYVGSVTNVITQ